MTIEITTMRAIMVVLIVTGVASAFSDRRSHL